MDVRRRDLEELRRTEVSPCVSLTLSLSDSTPGTDVDRQRLIRMLADAEGALVASGLGHREATELLAPARGVADTLTWSSAWRGLALYAAPGVVREFALWSPVSDRAIVADRFLLAPLVAELTRAGRYWLLTVSRGNPTLFRGTATGLRRVDLQPPLPTFADVTRADEHEESLQYHRGGGGTAREAATYHGHGGAPDAQTDQVRRWTQALADRVDSLLYDDHAPLVLAGISTQVARYRRHSRYAEILPHELSGSPDRVIDVDLHLQAWPLVEAHLAARAAEDQARFAATAGTGRTSTVAGDVALAATEGAVEVLFATIDPPPDDELLVDEAVVATWETGGTVHVLDEPIPGGGSLAAILRYVTVPVTGDAARDPASPPSR